MRKTRPRVRKKLPTIIQWQNLLTTLLNTLFYWLVINKTTISRNRFRGTPISLFQMHSRQALRFPSSHTPAHPHPFSNPTADQKKKIKEVTRYIIFPIKRLQLPNYLLRPHRVRGSSMLAHSGCCSRKNLWLSLLEMGLQTPPQLQCRKAACSDPFWCSNHICDLGGLPRERQIFSHYLVTMA